MNYAYWCGVRRQADEAVRGVCKAVADEFGLDYEVKAIERHLQFVAHPDPGGFGFCVRVGHLDTHDLLDVQQFHLPPDKEQWPVWLDYLGYMLRFHWSHSRIGDRALWECLGHDPEIDVLDIAEKAEST